MALPVSQAWTDAIASQFRYPAYLRVTLRVVPPNIREGAVATSTQTESITSIATTIDGVAPSVAPVATFEPQRWRCDGSMYLPSSNPAENLPVEWWNNTGSYSLASPATILFTFDALYTIPGIFVTWDTETNSWPTDFNIVGLDASDNVLSATRVTTNARVAKYYPAPFDNIRKIRLEIYAWSKPQWRVRLNEIVFGLTAQFDTDSVISAKFNGSVSLLSEELPKAVMSIDLNNMDKFFDPTLTTGVSPYMAERQLVEIQWGFETSYRHVEWMDAWPMFLSAWKIPHDTPQVNLQATTRLALLTDEYTRGVYTGTLRNFKAIAEELLENSAILRTDASETPWEIDPTFANFQTRAPIPIGSTNATLQLLCNASGYLLGTDLRNGFVRIRASGGSYAAPIGPAQQLGKPQYTIKSTLQRIRIGLRSFNPKATSEEVFKGVFYVSGSSVVEIRYNNGAVVQSPTVTVTNGTLVAATYYARSAVLTISGTGTVTVVVNGTIVEESTSFITTYENPLITNGFTVEVDNPFITEVATATALSAKLLAYYSRRNHLSIPYLGYPELELGDSVYTPTEYAEANSTIVATELSFNGGFSGKVDTIVELEV